MRRLPLRSLVGAGVLATAALVLAAPAASAKPIAESTIRSECRAAGGTYMSTVLSLPDGSGSMRFSTCQYQDISGNRYTDYYAGGEYYSTREH